MLELCKPVKPYAPIASNQFGADPAYYAKFLDRHGDPQKGHPGIDIVAAHATPLFAPCSGAAWYVKDNHGGDGIYIRTPNNGDPQYTVILWHLCAASDPQFHPLIPTDGTIVDVKTGQQLGFTDNTGAPYESSGDHLHLGLFPCDHEGAALAPDNGFAGCIDPAPFISDLFAEDVPQYESTIQKIAAEIKELSQEIKNYILNNAKKI